MSTELRWTIGKSLPVILIAAVVQGWALYALHMAVRGSYWTATEPAALYSLYAVAVFVPLTVMVLADHVQQRALWVIVASLVVLYAYFGWYAGANVVAPADSRWRDDDWF